MLLSACAGREEPVEKVNWYLHRYSANSSGVYEQIDTLMELDHSLDTGNFFLCRVDTLSCRGAKHLLRTYSFIPKVICSGGTFYCLDELGVIYNRDDYHGSYYSRKFSDNDSINDLISQAMAYILSLERLRSACPSAEMTRVSDDFVIPKIKRRKMVSSIRDSASH